MDETENPNNPITDLLTAYEELNSNIIDEFHEEPSPLEFMRYVAQNRPFVVRKGAAEWKATKCWNAEYLKEKLKDLEVNVAITPFGYESVQLYVGCFANGEHDRNADAPTVARDGSLMYVYPPLHHPFRYSQVSYVLTKLHYQLHQTPRRNPPIPSLPKLHHKPRPPLLRNMVRPNPKRQPPW